IQRALELVEALARLEPLAVERLQLRRERVEVAAQPVLLARHRLDVLEARQPRRLLGLVAGLQAVAPHGQPRDLGVESPQRPRGALHALAQDPQLLLELADRPLAPEDRVVVLLALAVPPAAAQPTRRRENLSGSRDVRRHHAVAPPEGLGLIQV